MNLIRWNPLYEIEELDNLFNNRFFLGRRGEKDEPDIRKPISDIVETQNDYRIKAEMPGIPKENITLSVEENVLTLKGEKKQEKEEKGKNHYRSERTYGLYERKIALPRNIRTEKIKAGYKDGVLEVVIPKEKAKEKKEIKVIKVE